jgi:hypothetical protein
MSDFILKQREFDVVPTLLLEADPPFGHSDEFKALDEKERKVAGLVCAAFTKHLLHLHEALSRSNAGEAQRVELEQCYAAIERLASSPDPAVQNLVVVEVFENIPDLEALQNEIEPRLKPKSLDLYNRWVH